MKSLIRKSRLQPSVSRRGAAAVECAIIAPLMTLLLLGAIDVGQFANVYQKVSDASRHGARVASRYGTTTTGQVEAAVMDYLEQACPNVAPGDIRFRHHGYSKECRRQLDVGLSGIGYHGFPDQSSSHDAVRTRAADQRNRWPGWQPDNNDNDDAPSIGAYESA